MLKSISLAAVLVIGAVPVAAQTSSASADGKKLDPNRKICEKIEITGSRLRTQKICMTAEQWETKRQQEREQLERIQQNTDPSRSG